MTLQRFNHCGIQTCQTSNGKNQQATKSYVDETVTRVTNLTFDSGAENNSEEDGVLKYQDLMYKDRICDTEPLDPIVFSSSISMLMH